MRRFPKVAIAFAVLAALAACADQPSLTTQQRDDISAQLERQVKTAYDITKPGLADRLLSLYPDTGRVISASGGQVLTTRDSLATGINYFVTNVAANMQSPEWIWDQMLIDVLGPNSAAMTATYHIPHRNPAGEPHVIAGAWTAVFQKRGGRWVIVQEHLSDRPAMPAMADSMSMPDTMPMSHSMPMN